MIAYVFFNPLSGNPTAFAAAMEKIKEKQGDNAVYRDIREVEDWRGFFASIAPEDVLCICGGDGTLNRFVNATDGIAYSNDVYYWATGTGNDFLKDIGGTTEEPVRVNEYIKELPLVTVKGKTHRFLNGVGYGIDGYCCEVGDMQKETSDKPVNYTAIAIKGLLFHYRPTCAKVTVDGKDYEYRKVWIAPTMHGRYYGGGMMPTPAQDRSGREGTNSLMLFHGSGKLHTLMVFPSLFTGEHVKHEKNITIHEGKHIKVAFDRPVALQIDGETILNVSEYEVTSASIKSGVDAEIATVAGNKKGE